MIKKFIVSAYILPSMITKNLADFIIQTEYRKIPENVIEKAKLCFMDFLAVTLRGSRSKSGMAVNNILKEGNESTIIGFKKASTLDASIANGIIAHSLDLDDGHRIAHIHPGACVIPSALSLSEVYKKSGKKFISSMVVGYEIAISLGIMVNPQHRNRGFHSTGTCGTFGAVSAASKALNLEKENLINAFGLAGTQACGLLESDHAGTMAKHLHAGKAAQSGVMSALLAKNGFTGASTIIDGKEGFLSAMVDHDFAYKEKYKKINVGEFHIKDVYFKKYPVCRHLHSAIDAALDIINEDIDINMDIKYDDIQKIIVKTYKTAALHDNYNPVTDEAIRQSLPVSIAIAILNGTLDLNKIKITEEVNEIANKVVIKCDDNLDDLYPNKRPSEVTISTKNGSYKKKVCLPKGEPENPFKKEEIIDKFINLNPNVEVNVVIHIIDDLESYNMKDVMNILNKEFIRANR